MTTLAVAIQISGLSPTVQYLQEMNEYLYMSCNDGTLRIYPLYSKVVIRQVIVYNDATTSILANNATISKKLKYK
jgi:hypothetical protein